MPNLREIRKRLEAIEASKNDSEAAHLLEDRLLWDFVSDIVAGKQRYITRAAEEISKSKNINFSRWTA